jgi:3-methyladenine DNA glycosylase AlkC
MTKGVSRISDVTPALRVALEAGEQETRTLSEGLAIDFAQLLRAVKPELSKAAVEIDAQAGVTRRMAQTATILLRELGEGVITSLMMHRSDTVRGWSAYMIAQIPELTLNERLTRLRPLADDPHFGVREWAWLAVRNHVAANVTGAMDFLLHWTCAPSSNIRRFAVEVTRPRGVWSAHIPALKSDPSRGLVLLEPLRSDPARYVQDSVANWLNDAGKTNPSWLISTCDRWENEQPGNFDTQYILRRARRSLKL